MKIAFATDDLLTISAHLGRAQKFLVVTLDDAGQVVDREPRDKPAHGQHHDHHDHSHSGHFHDSMASVIPDCDFVVARGMGRPAFAGMQAAGIEPLLTDIATINNAVAAWQAGELINHPERAH